MFIEEIKARGRRKQSSVSLILTRRFFGGILPMIVVAKPIIAYVKTSKWFSCIGTRKERNDMRRFRWTLIVAVLSMISSYAHAAGMTIVNGRYFSNASGTPKFLVGYQDYAIGSTRVNYDVVLSDVVSSVAPYGVNYIRSLISQAQYTATTDPPSTDGSTSRTPFLYVGQLVNLDEWDSTFWTNLKADIEHAATHGIFMHLTIFDGVSIANFGNSPWCWYGSDWNVNRQIKSFYGDLDANSDGDANDSNEFCNTTAFQNGTGVGYYQKRLIDKLIVETGGYNNVFFEVGNEMGNGTCPAWSVAVRAYIKTKTDKPVTHSSCYSGGYCTQNLSTDGWTDHRADTVAEVKSYVAGMVGHGYPAMVDPDGGDMMNGDEDEVRQAAWYSLTGGAYGWGGFTTDMWRVPNQINTTKLKYFGYLLGFLDSNAVRFWEMTPQQSLISTNSTNSLLANVGAQYLAYVLSGATVNITLGTGTYSVKYFNPVTGVTTSGTDTTGPAARTFSRPTGASDWVVFVSINTAPYRVPQAPSGITVQ